MPIEITVPRLGWSMEEGLFGAWLKAHGDAVTAGEPIYSLESDKVTMEVESLDNGTLFIPADAPGPGAVVTVGQLLGYLLINGETAPAPKPAAVTPARASVGTAPAPQPVETTPEPASKIPASPRARAAARELGIDIARVSPRAGARRIVEADVRKLATTAPKPARQLIATRMEESFRAPHFYLHADANAEPLARIRNAHRPASYNDFLIKAIALALVRHAKVNAYWDGTGVTPRVTQHIALAAQIGDTLQTPVIANPAEKSVPQIARDREAVLDRCRLKQARPADFENASATLTNLGPFGVDRFQAILNPPQSIIVAVGKIAKRPVVVDDQVVGRLTMPISLSVDHRVIDGVAAAAFLQTLIGILESPAATYNDWE